MDIIVTKLSHLKCSRITIKPCLFNVYVIFITTKSNEEELEPKHTPQEPFFICSNFLVDVLSWLEGSLAHSLSSMRLWGLSSVVFSRPFAKRPPRPRVVRLPNFYLVGLLLLLLEHTSAILTAEYPKAGANTQLVRARARAQTNTHLSRKGALLHAFASVFEPVQFSLYWPAPSYSSSPLKGRGAKVKHLAGLPERASLAGSSRGIFHSLTSSTKVQKIGYNLV